MSCLLRISGESLDIETALSTCTVQPYLIWKKGEPRPLEGKTHRDSGANFAASEADFDELPLQLAEATIFLETHASALARLVATPGVQSATLDLGLAFQEGNIAQSLHFPSTFINLAARIGIALNMSQYACTGD
ncbi:hypothetical protein [Pseudomonas sp. PA15(2017)]|uniref:hypothetical protein n=1 Tax=Pseudomonas sp. PA15(2017) TaxID=1932111 RepID=UPI00117A1385|nr:hypothetical protein [Pseudomonas sp. PA15(2017)]